MARETFCSFALLYSFLVDAFLEGFGEQVCRVLNARDVLNVNDTPVNAIMNVVDADVHVLHV